MILAFEMRAGQAPFSRSPGSAEHVADAVDFRLEPGLAHAVRKPFPRRDVLIRQGRTMHAGLVGAEGRKGTKIGQDAFGIDAGHE